TPISWGASRRGAATPTCAPGWKLSAPTSGVATGCVGGPRSSSRLPWSAVPAADLLPLGEVHAIRVVPTDDGPRAAPFVRRDGEWRRATAGHGGPGPPAGRACDSAACPPAPLSH